MNARTQSTAVMARRVEPADSLDFFPTPPWATRALCEHVLPGLVGHAAPAPPLSRMTALDPACGEGHMALVLDEYFADVGRSDIFPYGGNAVADFLHPDYERGADWIITNPPFNRGADFVLKALDLAQVGVAVLVRTAFLEGEGRFEQLFSRRPPSVVAQFIERVPMHRGRWVVDGSTATSYCWLVWLKGGDDYAQPTLFAWIPKSRRALAKHDDWLRFSGCTDIPAEHQAIKLQDGKARGHTKADLPPARPATIGDIARELGALGI